MTVWLFVAQLAGTVLCMMVTRYFALRRGRTPTGWVWAAAFLGPVPLVALAVLSERRQS